MCIVSLSFCLTCVSPCSGRSQDQQRRNFNSANKFKLVNMWDIPDSWFLAMSQKSDGFPTCNVGKWKCTCSLKFWKADHVLSIFKSSLSSAMDGWFLHHCFLQTILGLSVFWWVYSLWLIHTIILGLSKVSIPHFKNNTLSAFSVLKGTKIY